MWRVPSTLDDRILIAEVDLGIFGLVEFPPEQKKWVNLIEIRDLILVLYVNALVRKHRHDEPQGLGV